MPNALYIEPFSGIAGDMMLSALCGLADAYDEILELPDKLHLHEAKVELQTLNKNGIVCKHIKITDLGEVSHEHHTHEDGHAHSHGPHRHLSDIVKLIQSAHLPEPVKEKAIAIFTLIGESESRIHDIPLSSIHFHEVSGVDSILDIVGCSLMLHRLEIEEAYCDPICTGFGQVKTQHGQLPVPAPATADILRGMPTVKGDEPGERCTPTGAAILKFLNPRFSPPPRPTCKIAYGPGQKDFKSANVVRLSLLESAKAQSEEVIWAIQANLDDHSPELLGLDFQQGLLDCGAIDFHFTATLMKKGRPGLLIEALAPASQRDTVADFILENTSTIGVRFHACERRILARRKVAIDTEFGTLLAKETVLPSGQTRLKYEYDSLKELAESNQITIASLQRQLDPHSPRKPI